MIYCTVQSLDKYSVERFGGRVRTGIGMIAEEKPALFSLLSIASPLLYQWEPGSPVPEDSRAAALDDYLQRLYLETLTFSIGGVPITGWLSMLDSPVSFYLNLNSYSLAGMPLLDFYNVDQVRLIMRARCRSWMRHNKHDNYQTLSTVFTEEDERIVKENAYVGY